MKKSLIVGNWKMHFNASQASIFVHHLNKVVTIHRSVEVVLAPSLLTLQPLSLEVDHRKFKLAAQNAYFKDEGAFTGEVSFTMLHDLADYCIIGHSERRLYFHETLENIRDKVSAAIRNDIKPILCIGETKAERLAGQTKNVISEQIASAVSNLTSHEIHNLVIAYEPVWAISTFGGETARPSDIQKDLDLIRYQVSQLFGAEVAKQLTVIYGGSVSAETVSGYLALDGCDGALVGGASLKYLEFADIINKAYIIKQSK